MTSSRHRAGRGALKNFRKKLAPTWPFGPSDDACQSMSPSTTAACQCPPPVGRPDKVPATTPDDVADRLDTMAVADQALEDDLDRLSVLRRRACDATVERLEQLLALVRAGARACAELEDLAGLDSKLLQDGALLWTARCDGRPPVEAASPCSSTGRRLSVVGGADTAAVWS